MHDFEKLGAFYLGKLFDLENDKLRDELLLYDSKDLTTHAVCVGMTGSGKTGLCLSLLEEAAIDGIPAIAIDPKGDLGNLLLTFPDLQPEDFRPWIDESSAAREGLTPEQFATKTADKWKAGLAEWGQDAARIARFRDAVSVSIYTPGSNAGLPLTVLRSFTAPSPQIVENTEALRERIGAATSGLLALLGIDADPIQSREYILIAKLLDHAWKEGRDLDVGSLIRDIQKPPFESVGVFDLESFSPAKERVNLSMSLNNLLASPSFAGWMEGESLDIKSLLYTSEGKPRLSIISIAHLSDSERMFFVTILLNEVLTWVRSQPGTSSLRALLYMDEVFGYFPPTANPPSKAPMLTLLKQARAYGLGVVLATQNPVDLDYKGLSNTGTWFLGRLQTERDKARVLEGLEGASAQASVSFDRQKMEAMLAGLGSRVFLMNNVHDDHPVVFQTRWALSYLRGPLTRSQIETLMAPLKNGDATPPASAATSPPKPQTIAAPESSEKNRPVLAPEVKEWFLARTTAVPEDSRLLYRPALLGRGRLHFVRSTYNVDDWQQRAYLSDAVDDFTASVWEAAHSIDLESTELENDPDPDGEFAAVGTEFSHEKNFATWQKQLKDYAYRNIELTLWKCAKLKMYSQCGESEGDFRIRLGQAAHERRDLEIEKLRKKFSSKLQTVQSRIRTAEERIARETSQSQRATIDSAISIGSSILGALFGRKLLSKTNIGKASTSMRSVGRAAQQRGDIARAEDKLKEYQQDLSDLESQFNEEVEKVQDSLQVDSLELEAIQIRPRKSDIQIQPIEVIWTPWLLNSSGMARAAFELKTYDQTDDA